MTAKTSLLLRGFLVLVVLGLLFVVAPSFWDLRWFDSLMHFLGGLSVGVFSLWVWWVSGLFGKGVPSKKEVFIAAVLAAIIAGAGWEFFEYVNGIANPIGNYALDTFNDVFADIIGGVAAGIWGAQEKFYSITKNHS